jgi:hypothetical protein
VQRSLRVDRGVEGVLRCVEGNAEGVPDDLKDETVMCLRCLMQDCVMSSQKGGKGIRMALCDVAAGLDVGEEERDGAGRKIMSHAAR